MILGGQGQGWGSLLIFRFFLCPPLVLFTVTAYRVPYLRTYLRTWTWTPLLHFLLYCVSATRVTRRATYVPCVCAYTYRTRGLTRLIQPVFTSRCDVGAIRDGSSPKPSRIRPSGEERGHMPAVLPWPREGARARGVAEQGKAQVGKSSVSCSPVRACGVGTRVMSEVMSLFQRPGAWIRDRQALARRTR